jgi:Flp pilus assembly protein TadG
MSRTRLPRQVGRVGSVRCRLLRDDRGAVTAELAVAMPLLLLVILLIAQFAVWAHATHIAQAAASETLAATRVYGGSTSMGYVEANHVIAQLGDGPLRSPATTITRGAQQSTVEVRGEAASVVPFLHLPVVARAVGPTERVTPGGIG